MKYDYDFRLEVAYPKEAMDPLGDIIYRHGVKVWNYDGVSEPSISDEIEVLTTLFAVARLAEINVRIAWQNFCTKENLAEDDNPRNYIDVLKLVDKYFKNDPVHWLYNNALSVSDGMLHGNFYQAYIQARKAYDRDDLGLTQTNFVSQRIALTKLGSVDVKIDAQTGIVTTSNGNEYPHKSYVPGKSKTIEENFVAFYTSAAFVSVYDVLFTAFNRAYHFRRCIEFGKQVSAENR